jgi:hypothetical protein
MAAAMHSRPNCSGRSALSVDAVCGPAPGHGEGQLQVRRQHVVVALEQLHDLAEVAAGHKGLAEHRVGAEIQALAQAQAQGRVAGQAAWHSRQSLKARIRHPGADGGNALGQTRAREEIGLRDTGLDGKIDQDQRVLCGRAAAHAPIWPQMTLF